jgi:hypothetical protein
MGDTYTWNRSRILTTRPRDLDDLSRGEVANETRLCIAGYVSLDERGRASHPGISGTQKRNAFLAGLGGTGDGNTLCFRPS